MSDPAAPAAQAVPAATAVDAAGLLPAQALQGRRIGLSVSDSADLARLGLGLLHQQLVVRELARTVLVGGGTLAYGGHLRPGGFTRFLVGELGQYARAGLFGDAPQQRALLLCLAWQEHRRNSLAELDQVDAELDLYGELRCLDRAGQALRNRSAGRSPEPQPDIRDVALLEASRSAQRRHMVEHTAARVLLGGRRHATSSKLPGLLEEGLLALQAGQPLYLAAGLGGTTLDMAAVIDPQCAALCPRQPTDPPPGPGAAAGLAALRAWIGDAGWQRLDNGLDDDENRHLAMTHRPAEIAALVSLGLGRWAQRQGAAAGPAVP